jgi:hypothetical protein
MNVVKQNRIVPFRSFAALAALLASACIARPAAVEPTPIPPTAPAPTAAPTKPPPPPTTAPTLESTPIPTAAPKTEATPENKLENFAAAKFDKPTEINNEWMPLKPGTRYVYEGSTVADDGSLVPHRIEVHVTDLVKEIGGVPSRATWDLDFSNDVLAEAELAFFAQDNAGNVWRMGEYPEVYEEGKLVEAPSWIHGFQDAQAGIMMPAKPQTGTPSYSQGWGPAVNWTDRGQVDQMGQKTCVPVKCYEDVLIVAETSQAEPDAQQLKYWAKGVGNVRVGWRGSGEKTQEELQLTKLEQMDAAAMEAVHIAALKLEKSAYENSKEVYARTPPLTSASGASLPNIPDAPAAAATAAPKGGIVSPELLNVEVQVEDILDVLLSDDWETANEDIAKIDKAWASYQKQALKDGASQSTLDDFTEMLAEIKTVAEAKDVAKTMQAANDLSAIIVDLYDVYKPATPTDLGRLDVLERQVVLDLDIKDFAAAEKTLAQISTIWERVKPTVLSQNPQKSKAVAEQFDESLTTQAELLKKRDLEGVQDEARNSLEIVDALERLY